MKNHRITPLRIIVHVGGFAPLAHLLFSFFTDDLTANPIQAIEQRTGLYALTFLVLSLACTPLATVFRWSELPVRRKALGNYGFMYATLHMATFFGIDYGLDFAAVLRDVWNKWYILIGATAYLMLLPLAITSFNYWKKRLGKNWKRLHKLVYIISPLVVIHFFLATKGDLTRLQGDLTQPLLYGLVVVILLVARIMPVKLALIQLRRQIEARGQQGAAARIAQTPEETPNQ